MLAEKWQKIYFFNKDIHFEKRVHKNQINTRKIDIFGFREFNKILRSRERHFRRRKNERSSSLRAPSFQRIRR